MKTVIPNGVTIYKNSEVTETLKAVVDEYASLWTNKGSFVDLPEEE